MVRLSKLRHHVFQPNINACVLWVPVYVRQEGHLYDAKLMSKQFALWAAFCHANNIVVKSAILLIFRHSHLSTICPSQCAIHCDDMCLAHCCPASSEQSSFLTKSIPIGNVHPNVLLPQSYATLTPYAPVFPRSTVHTIGPSIVARVDKSLHTYLKPQNKYHQLEGLLRFKKPIISR